MPYFARHILRPTSIVRRLTPLQVVCYINRAASSMRRSPGTPSKELPQAHRSSSVPSPNRPPRDDQYAASSVLSNSNRESIRKGRAIIYAVAAAAIVASSAWLGASLKRTSESEEARTKRLSATLEERMAELERAERKLLTVKEDIETKLERLSNRKAEKARIAAMQKEITD